MAFSFSHSIQHAMGVIRHFFTAGNEHGIHSPFVFKLLTEGIYSKKHEPVFEIIEKFRQQLLGDNTVIKVKDLGAGSTFDGRLNKRTIAEITAKFAKSPRHCRFLFRLAGFLNPAVIIELGTSLGISGMYLASANRAGKLYSLEGCPETAIAAKKNFDKNNFKNVTVITGNFNDTLLPLLNNLETFDMAYIDGNHTYEATLDYFRIFAGRSHKKSCIVFDDIYWSPGMKTAWEAIKADPLVKVSLDFYQFGVVFFNDSLTRQNFVLRL